MFMHDRPPHHMAKCVSGVFAENGNVKAPSRPGNLPDSNPIENVRYYVKG